MSNDDALEGGEFKPVLIQCPHCLGKIPLEIRRPSSLNDSVVMADGERVDSIELSILCVTRAEERTEPFLLKMRNAATTLGAQLVIAFDSINGSNNLSRCYKYADMTAIMQSSGYVESILQEAHHFCQGIWTLRLDDDEEISPAMMEWLRNREYTKGKTQIWSFPTAALWPDDMHFITNPPLWPDYHPRLFTWRYREWQAEVHAGAPYGMGGLAPVSILHHKYLVKSIEEREKIYEERDVAKMGDNAYAHMPFTLPERYFDKMNVLQVARGRVDNADVIRNAGQSMEIVVR